MHLLRRQRGTRRRHAGAVIAEMIVAFPTTLMIGLTVMQVGLAFHAKNNLNFAVQEAARAGARSYASNAAIDAGLVRAMTAYYGGGRDLNELTQALARAAGDLTPQAVRIEILSPTRESFEDYHSDALRTQLRNDPDLAPRFSNNERVLPLARPGFDPCASRPPEPCDPARNRSGQTLQDANLLKLRLTYGIPREKQVPLLGRFFTWALVRAGNDTDAFRTALVQGGRIPIVVHTTVRMETPPIENDRMVSNPGPGNDGTPVDPGPPGQRDPLPTCPVYDPTCASQQVPGGGGGSGGTGTPPPWSDPGGGRGNGGNDRPPWCRPGDPTCDPICRVACCVGGGGGIDWGGGGNGGGGSGAGGGGGGRDGGGTGSTGSTVP